MVPAAEEVVGVGVETDSDAGGSVVFSVATGSAAGADDSAGASADVSIEPMVGTH